MSENFTYLTGGLNVKHTPEFKMHRPNGVPNYVLLYTKTSASFTIKDETTLVESNSIVIIEPDSPYSYHNASGQYIDDWFHFECETFIFDKSGLPCNTFIPVVESTNINLLLQELIWEYNYAPEIVRDQNLSMLIQLILNNVYVSYSVEPTKYAYSPFNRKLKKLRLDIQSSITLNYDPTEIAASMDISTSYFQHLYKQLFGISFRKDIIQIKIVHAKHLMSTTKLSISQIANQCGYATEVHFYRQFKKVTGMTPSTYKKINKRNTSFLN
ncbi:AraC family transcriptional regulator [Marinilactibacillus sp. XAAS-LB27]|uniref:AraC family transcriptional regulator n=1 Tax=Marinilactibacillus sp. XAAS-LB27 TaxID=3114538 RepID=UPI002E16D968|nr:AraC family transcriptional regulator [Marinilactibacillus sp. XAAS-LB27]